MNSADLVACYGEILLRYSPTPGQSMRNASGLDIFVGGAEANVAAGLANLGRNARMISAVPDNELGAIARRALDREGVDTSAIIEMAGRMGTYYVTPAGPLQQSKVIYDRSSSSFAMQATLDTELVLAGVHHLHISGISLAVSARSRTNAIALAQAAKRNGLTVSFDGNYRPALWTTQDCDPQPIISEMVGLADVFFGNHKDMALLLGRHFSGDGPERRREAALAGFEAFGNLSAIASTARQVDRTGTHRIVGRIDTKTCECSSDEQVLSNVVDRIGTGDAFAAGIIDGWLIDRDNLGQALGQGMALSALKHYSAGDFSLANRAEMKAAIAGIGDVIR